MKLPRRNFLHLAAGTAALPAVSRVDPDLQTKELDEGLRSCADAEACWFDA